jgi:hypothetical protein
VDGRDRREQGRRDGPGGEEPRGEEVGGTGRPARSSAVVVVGDVVTARRFLDEPMLLEGLAGALARVDARVPARTPLRLAVRDEFHGVYDDLGTAAEAALRLRLATDDVILPTVDGIDEPVELRLGLGIGLVDTTTDHPSGSAWRHARDARADAQALPAKRTWPASMRSACRADDPVLERSVLAVLLLQDQLLARLDARDRRALTGILDGERQVDIADALGVTQPAIARRLRDRGALAIHRALLTLQGEAAPADGVLS